MASMKCGEIEGSPPENCTDIWRRGLIEMALSRMSFTSSNESSWTKPTWLASMKHGSHIMLQRFVRSIVSTEPRPNLMDEEPWSWSPSSLCAWMSRPGNIDSMCFRKFESMAMMSSKWPWMGQSLTIQIWPSRSMICALISPTFSLTRIDGSMVGAFRILLRASMTHFGHKLSVVRGKPSGGFDFCQDLSRGLSDHFGVNASFGLYWLKNWIVLKRPPATVASAFSACLIAFILRPFVELLDPAEFRSSRGLLFLEAPVSKSLRELRPGAVGKAKTNSCVSYCRPDVDRRKESS